MVHIPAKLRENTAMCVRATVRWTDGGGGAFQYLLSRAFGTAGDINNHQFFIYMGKNVKKCAFLAIQGGGGRGAG